jgi:ParB family chromosome partitioning protein
VSQRVALGRGLAALIPERTGATVPPPQGETFIPLALIEPNPDQPRVSIRPEPLQGLAQSIRESGVVQPIVVRPIAGGRYQIVAGERRWRAAQIAGIPKIPAIVRKVSDEKAAEFALIENIQREDLTPIEEGLALRRLQEALGLTQEGLAQKIGKDRATVANTMRLLRLPAEVKDAISRGALSAGHARALLALDSSDAQKEIALLAVQKGLSVRQVEERVRALASPSKPASAKKTDANTRAAEEKLRARLGARVEIVRRGRKGEIRVHFENESELDRLFNWMSRG